jgi:hypothetical protein
MQEIFQVRPYLGAAVRQPVERLVQVSRLL